MKTNLFILLLPILFFFGFYDLQAQDYQSSACGKLMMKWREPEQQHTIIRNTAKEKEESEFLSSAHHLPRTGDRVVRLEASYLEPGGQGENVVWDFNHLRLSGDEHELDYQLTPGSSLTGIAYGTMQSYKISGDSLLIWRYENPLTLVCLEKPEEVMVFPVSYGDERRNYFYGKGKYCDRLELDISGFTYSLADGHGMLVFPENDTIGNVFRVYTAKITLTDSRPVSMGFNVRSSRDIPLTYGDILNRLEQDTAYTFTETYRWYAEGSRYPVLETGSSQLIVNGKPVSVTNNTYVYHPEEQFLELPLDSDNRLVWEEKARNKSLSENEQPSVSNNFNIKTYPNPVIGKLHMDIRSSYAEKAEVHIYNLQGHLLYRTDFQIYAGNHHETVDMKSFERGNYILQVHAGEKSISKVILKH